MEALKLSDLQEIYKTKDEAELRRIFPNYNSKEMKPTAYISYPMTGYENHNIEAEKQAFNILRFQYQLYTPSKLKGFIDKKIKEPEYKHYLGNDIAALSRWDICFVLDGWQDSKGCLIEINFCHQMEIPVILFPSMQLLKPEDLIVQRPEAQYQSNYEIDKAENTTAFENLFFWFVTIGLCFFTLSGIIHWLSKII